MLQGRKETLPEGSYTTYLFQKGLDKILKKVGEESTEVIIAGKAQDKAETIYEIADLMYHVMVLMAVSYTHLDVYKRQVYELADLGVGKCRMCVAGKKDFRDDRSRTLRVATKFPRIARNYYLSLIHI